MTGDDHANNGTAGRFDQFIAASPSGCSVANWECVRGTSYIFTNPFLTNTQAAAYEAQGFEIGLHVNTGCADYTPAQLADDYSQQIANFNTLYPSVPAPTTQRHHCIAWSDWATGAKVQLANGIRLDTSYYYWPPSWVVNVPGLFTGSAMPMRFADLDGTLIDVYHVATQMTDESGQQYPYTIDTLLDRALGTEGYYGAYTINAHTDVDQIPESDAVVASALARGVPIITSRQMLEWLDGRNNSSFGALTWNGNALSFTVSPGTSANGLQGLVPALSSVGVLTGLTQNGTSLSFTTETIKGVAYARFLATAGNYVATYAADTTPPTVTTTTPAAGAMGISPTAKVTAAFSEGMDAASINGSSFELRNTASDVLVSATVTYSGSTNVATLTPTASLADATNYTVKVKSGASGVKDLAGNTLAADRIWSFTTGVAPVGCAAGSTIWPATTTPAVAADSDTSAVELGVKFRPSANGYICGLRFYKGTGNTGTHTGTLWSGTGTLLATATFANETATGWQQVDFASPVAVTANTVYVASYYAPVGRYAVNSSYFTAGVTNGPLYALQDGESGGNGVYRYGTGGGFPSSTFGSSNYWVDVVFTTTVGPDTTPPTVTGRTPANDAIDVAPTATVTATFSEAMNAATVTTATFELRNASNALVPTSVSYNAGTNTATLTPNSALTASATYTATVKGGASGVKDLAGNALAADATWTFTTAAADTTAPTVTNRTPASGATGVAPTATVTATFSEAMSAATITPTTFELRDAANALVPATVSYNAGANTATLTPSSTLVASTLYTATVKGGASGVKDAAGNALVADAIWSFTTSVDPAVCRRQSDRGREHEPGSPSSEWDVSGAGDLSIQGFATDISVNRGETVSFKIDTPSTDYRLDIYRMGYYGGLGARKIATIQPSAPLPQNQPSCLTNATGLMDCGNWAVSASWPVSATATSGIYFAKAVREDGANAGKASHIVFIVRNDASTSDVLFQTADTTWQAYNTYGGNSFYTGSGPGTGGASDGRAYKISYNRPFNTRNVDGGQDWVFNAEYPMVRWLEANGYDVSYFTGVDSDRRGSLIQNHKLFLSIGHDEYWSNNQRANVEAARNAGVHLAFFSGNEVFWKTRWEDSIDGAGTPYRTLVCYKETHSFNNNPDPTTAWTGTWRDPRNSPPKDGGRPGKRSDRHPVYGQCRGNDVHPGSGGGRQDAVLAQHQHRQSRDG